MGGCPGFPVRHEFDADQQAAAAYVPDTLVLFLQGLEATSQIGS